MATTDDRVRRRGAFRRPMLFLGLAMTIGYVGLGAWLLLDPGFLPYIPTEFRTIFAAMVLIYGVYRGWRIYADYF